ncbi:MAG TPA: YidC/Oxa1 family membrane protein insertase [Dehalococcoidia bacterium]|jgi:YidC/Oxa1 family membrane protein insertase
MDLVVELFHFLLVVPMTNVLVALARVFGGNYGIAIIVFTLVMKFVTFPLTSSQYKASRAMQAVQPKLQELQKKYKGKDPKKLQAETMALYKEAGVNPLGCIFPLLVQMPIWIALYQVIRTSLGETPESFVSLSQQLYPIPFIHSAVPLENTFFIWNLGQSDATLSLPILVAATMYIQQKMITPTPKVAPRTQQEIQQQQTQQMMGWMLPLMFGYFAFTAPAGLGLYWLVSNLSGIVLQYFYLGRKVDWVGMLRFGSPAPAPGTAAGAKAVKPAQQDERNNKSNETVAESTTDDESDDQTEPAAVAASAGTRRKRHGRRRGKR